MTNLTFPVIAIGARFLFVVRRFSQDEYGNKTEIPFEANTNAKMDIRQSMEVAPELVVSTTNGMVKFEGNALIVDIPGSATADLPEMEEGLGDMVIWPDQDKDKAELFFSAKVPTRKMGTEL